MGYLLNDLPKEKLNQTKPNLRFWFSGGSSLREGVQIRLGGLGKEGAASVVSFQLQPLGPRGRRSGTGLKEQGTGAACLVSLAGNKGSTYFILLATINNL